MIVTFKSYEWEEKIHKIWRFTNSTIQKSLLYYSDRIKEDDKNNKVDVGRGEIKKKTAVENPEYNKPRGIAIRT